MTFLKKGGKVIWYHGGSQRGFRLPLRAWYYKQLAWLLAAAVLRRDDVRLFMVPGMGSLSLRAGFPRTALIHAAGRSTIG